MPPTKRLPEETIAAFTRWVKEGAYWPAQVDRNGAGTGFRADRHWAFQPIHRPAPPNVVRGDWPRNAIDRFVLAKLEQNKLAPSPRAAMPVLLRRISFDVTGLPDTTKVKEVGRIRAPDTPGGFHEVYAYKHSDGRALVFTTTTGAHANVYDVGRFAANPVSI